MSDDRRIFNVTQPEMTKEMIAGVPAVRDGVHLELFYNLIFSDIGFTLPDHLRPIVWALGDPNIKSLMIIISPGAGKSQLASIAYPAWELGLNQNNTILGVSAGADLMMGWLQTFMDIVENNKIYKVLFPHIKPDKDMGWSTNRGAFVKRTVTGQANPSYEAIGCGSSRIVGKHAKLLIIDDIHSDENSSSSEQIDKVDEFYYKTLIGRKDPQGSRMIMIGRRWAADDLYGRLKSSGDWLTMTMANFRDTEQLYFDVRIPAKLSCVFNNFEPNPMVEDVKVVYGYNENPKGFFWIGSLGEEKLDEAIKIRKNKPDIFETVYQSNPESASTRIFDKNEFRDFIIPDDMYLGRTYDSVAEFIGKLELDLLVQSWDTAMTSESLNDPSVGYVVGLKSCTKDHRSQEPNPKDVPFHFDMYILDENYKRLQIGDLKVEVVDYYNKWRPNYVIVEASLAGIPIIQALESDGIEVIPVKVAHISKRQRATNGSNAGSAQGWARQGNILIPHRSESGLEVTWATNLLNELDSFTGAKGRRDDRVDAMVQAANFAIEFGIRTKDLPEGWRTEIDIDNKMRSWEQPVDPLSRLISGFGIRVQNPMYGLCGSCSHYKNNNFCDFHKIQMPKIGTCPMYDMKSEKDSYLLDIEVINGRKQ